MTDKPKSIEQLYNDYMDCACEHIMKRIRDLGGDGVVAPDVTYEGCGCGIDDFPACGESLDELDDCFPAKGEPGEFEGQPCIIYRKIGDVDESSR